MIVPPQSRDADDLLTRIGLLIGQSFFLGLTLGLLIVAAIALLVSIYGAGALPWAGRSPGFLSLSVIFFACPPN